MSLPKFNIIVAVDKDGGISKNGAIPWDCPSDRKFFKWKTVGEGKNVVIMGKNTYLSLPDKYRPLPDRKCIVISSTLNSEDHPEIQIYPELLVALVVLGSRVNSLVNSDLLGEIYIIGGTLLYYEALTRFRYLCKRVYVTKLHASYGCDNSFPLYLLPSIDCFVRLLEPIVDQEFDIGYYEIEDTHQEYKYLNLIQQVLNDGEQVNDRTGVGTYMKFGGYLEFDIQDEIPLITTKKIFYLVALKELLWMIRGQTDSKILEQQNVNIWRANSTREFLDDRGLNEYDEGQLGPIYGHQWRNWGGLNIDQLANVIEEIRENPTSRRLMVNAWNVADLPKMALPPCHFAFQFNVSGGWLDCQVYQRSADLFLGIPFNMFEYAVLTYMVAHLCYLKPRKLSLCLGNIHVYKNHWGAVNTMLTRTPMPWAKLRFKDTEDVKTIDDFTLDHFEIEQYKSWGYIAAKMAV